MILLKISEEKFRIIQPDIFLNCFHGIFFIEILHIFVISILTQDILGTLTVFRMNGLLLFEALF